MLYSKVATQLHFLRRNLGISFLWTVFFLPFDITGLTLGAKAQLNSDFQTPVERELYESSPGGSDKNSIFDATNPMQLMNILRRATAMDDATPPSDAVDQALRAFENQDGEVPMTSTSELSLP